MNPFEDLREDTHMNSTLRLIALAALLSAAACASLPPPSPIVAQSRAIDRQLGGS